MAGPSDVSAPVPNSVAAAPAVWSRSRQIALGVLLGAGLFLLVYKSLTQSLQAGFSTLPAQRVELNSAEHADLLLLPGVGENLAERIIKARAQAPFQKVEDLRKVPGIGPATLERLRPLVYVAMKTPLPRTDDGLPLNVEPFRRPGAKPKKGSELAEPIDVNKADAAELQKLPGIGPKMAERVMDSRRQKPFQSIDDLRRVKGIGPKTLDKIRPYVTVGKSSNS
jgi:competence protein ComEA